MYPTHLAVSQHTISGTELFPLLDEEFDQVENSAMFADDGSIHPITLFDDLAWDDQLDNGDEMSLNKH